LRRDLSFDLFAAGFVRPHFQATRDGWVALAERGELAPPRARPARLTVVMPVFNERETFPKVIDQLLAKTIAGVEIDIVIVESNSSDGTREEVLALGPNPRVHVVLEDRPSGKGHAVRAGLAAATGDYVVIQDADLEYDIADYDALLAPLLAGETGFVLGVRTPTDGAKWGVRHFERATASSRAMNFGNTVFLALFNLVYQQRLKDPFTMYKVIRRDCLTSLILECNRFDFDWELTAKMLRAGYRPVEVPVSYQSRSFAEGKKISVLRDPITWVVAAFKYRVAPVDQPL
jgi:glycosyltransferase involved in cell wall biosynthesis